MNTRTNNVQNVLTMQKQNLQDPAEEKFQQPPKEAPPSKDAPPAEAGRVVEKKTKEDSLVESNWDQVFTSFDDMDLNDNLLRGIFATGFEKPSTIQQRAIVPVIKGHDTIAQAHSGTGKTATFSIACLQKVDLEVNANQALILSPTRELAHQIFNVLSDLGSYMKIKAHACVGGTAVGESMRKLREGQHIVV